MMAIDRQDAYEAAPAPRATRCQLILAALSVVGISAAGWLLVAHFIL